MIKRINDNCLYNMNILIKGEDDSARSSEQPSHKLQSLLQRLSIKALRSAENVLDESMLESIQKKYSEYSEEGNNVVSFLQFFIFSLINQLDKLQQIVSIDILKEDYETLESAVQKSQAQIRNHIRIQQQLKIYLDSLEEKVEDLEKKLEIQEARYSQLFETLREMEEQRRDLQRKLSIRDEGIRQKSKSNSNYSTINENNYKQYLAYRRNNKGSKPKAGQTKFQPRKQSRGEQKHSHLIEGAIQINLSNNIVVSKKNSYDQNLSRPQNPVSNDSSIRELTKTVQMKQPRVVIQKRPNRKISKYKTQIADDLQRKEFRSNSVCG